MSNRFTVNALAALVICGGAGTLLGAQPAEASAFDYCQQYREAKLQHTAECMNLGGTSIEFEGWCSATGYYLESDCKFGGGAGGA